MTICRTTSARLLEQDWNGSNVAYVIDGATSVVASLYSSGNRFCCCIDGATSVVANLYSMHVHITAAARIYDFAAITHRHTKIITVVF